MVISALVVTLEPRAAADTLRRLDGDPRLQLGRPVGVRVPVVTETATCKDGERLFDELRALSGIQLVDVVMVDFSEEEPVHES